MTTWSTTIEKPSRIKEKIIKPAHRTNSEAGYVASRAKYTGSRKAFELEWDGMFTTSKDALQTQFDNDQGSSITWTHPETSTSYTVIFGNDEIEFTQVAVYLDGGNPAVVWATSVILIEQQ